MNHLNSRTTERVLAAMHEWGCGTISMLSLVTEMYPNQIQNHMNWLLENGYVQKLGHLKVGPAHVLRGAWFAPTRKRPAPFFTRLYPRWITLRKEGNRRPGDIPTSAGYMLPRHPLYVLRAVVALRHAFLNYFDCEIRIDSEHVIRSRAGENPLFSAPYKAAMGMDHGPMELLIKPTPDARCHLPEHGFLFRLEVECSRKRADRYQRVVEMAAVHGVPLLYVFPEKETYDAVVPLLPASENLAAIMLDDVNGLWRALCKFRLDITLFPDGVGEGKCQIKSSVAASLPAA